MLILCALARYEEQKLRLASCGLGRVLYLVEGDQPKKLSLTHVDTAMHATQVRHELCLEFRKVGVYACVTADVWVGRVFFCGIRRRHPMDSTSNEPRPLTKPFAFWSACIGLWRTH